MVRRERGRVGGGREGEGRGRKRERGEDRERECRGIVGEGGGLGEREIITW